MCHRSRSVSPGTMGEIRVMMTTYEKHGPNNDKMNQEGKKQYGDVEKRIIRPKNGKQKKKAKGKKRKNRHLAGQEMLAEKSRRGGGERKRGDWES